MYCNIYDLNVDFFYIKSHRFKRYFTFKINTEWQGKIQTCVQITRKPIIEGIMFGSSFGGKFFNVKSLIEYLSDKT